jgi:hypothetical protein
MIITCGPENNRDSFELTIPENRSIGIMLSSGADSAILLYLMCLELMQIGRSTDEIKYIFTVPKTDGAELHSAGIVDWINQKLGINLPQPIIFGAENVQDLHHSLQISESVRAVFDKYDPTFQDLHVFLADQRAVPQPWPFESAIAVDPFRVSENPYPEIISLPFNHLYKTHTIDLHFMFSTEPLLELSHSCTTNTVGRCNMCYHCHERQWAFDQLGKIDPGTN